jgi:hypothetical protein
MSGAESLAAGATVIILLKRRGKVSRNKNVG